MQVAVELMPVLDPLLFADEAEYEHWNEHYAREKNDEKLFHFG